MNKRVVRPAVVASYLAILALGVCGFRLVCSSSDFPWGNITAVSLFGQEYRRREHLKQLWTASHQRRDAKRRVVEEVIDRRRTLAEAIATFRALGSEWPDYSTVAPLDLSPDAEQERAYQRIVSFVEEILKDRPEEAKAVAERLEREYQMFRTSPGLRSAQRTGPVSTGGMKLSRLPAGSIFQ